MRRRNISEAQTPEVMVRIKRPVVRPEGPVRRTSLEISLQLWQKAKAIAALSGRTLQDLLLDGLRTEVAKRRKACGTSQTPLSVSPGCLSHSPRYPSSCTLASITVG
jgi:hypothetical protein